VTLGVFQSCETLDLDVVDSPNAVNPTTADVDLFINAIQLRLTDFIDGVEGSGFDGISEFGMEPVRMIHGFGPSYRELNDPADFNQLWGTAYSSALADIRAMTPLAVEAELYTHIAISQVIEAYIMMTLVDFFGDVPYTEAARGNEGIFNPVADSGESIYAAADQLLIDAIANFDLDEVNLPTNDVYYNGDESKWKKLANTLRLKLYLQTRLVDSNATSVINGLISDGDLILDTADDFQFQYSTSAAAPDSRHPFFEKTYSGTGPSSDFYMANYYMDLLENGQPTSDPRTRYYFYRQVGDFSGANVVTNDCVTQNRPAWYSADEVYCTVGDGFWGRDHLNPDGIPPDQQFRAMFGVYPVGGAFDDDSFRNVSGSTAINEGLQGAGINPIMLASYTNFMLAEAALTLGTTGDAATYLEAGMRESITKTMIFSASVANGSSFIPTSGAIDTYIASVMAEYNGGSDDDKLRVIVEQYFIALWTNGVEAYNTYRRTGHPSDIQPAVELSDPGVFQRSNWYPATAADNNINLTQKDGVTAPVFWDTNPASLFR